MHSIKSGREAALRPSMSENPFVRPIFNWLIADDGRHGSLSQVLLSRGSETSRFPILEQVATGVRGKSR